MFISVIIPTCDRPFLLTNCLLSLANQSGANGVYFEAIISDDSYLSSARPVVHKYLPFAKWVKGPGCGPAANRNNGAIYASGDWFAFVDDDCIPDEDYLENIVKAIVTNPLTGIFEGYVYPGREKERYDEESPVNATGGNLWSCNMVIRRNLFLLLRGFCEEFLLPAMEDMDFHLTVKQHNIPVQFVGSIRICHPWRRRKSLNFRLSAIRSIQLLCTRHPVVRQEFNRSKYLHHLFAGIVGRTRLLLKFRFRGIRGYLEDHLILLYYIVKIGSWK